VNSSSASENNKISDADYSGEAYVKSGKG